MLLTPSSRRDAGFPSRQGPQGRRARAVAHRADPDTRHTGDDHVAGRRLAGRRLEGRWLAADRNGSADDAAGTPPELTSSSAAAPPFALASWRPPFPAQASSEVSSRSLVFSSSWLFLSPFLPFPSSPGTPATDPAGAPRSADRVAEVADQMGVAFPKDGQ